MRIPTITALIAITFFFAFPTSTTFFPDDCTKAANGTGILNDAFPLTATTVTFGMGTYGSASMTSRTNVASYELIVPTENNEHSSSFISIPQMSDSSVSYSFKDNEVAFLDNGDRISLITQNTFTFKGEGRRIVWCDSNQKVLPSGISFAYSNESAPDVFALTNSAPSFAEKFRQNNFGSISPELRTTNHVGVMSLPQPEVAALTQTINPKVLAMDLYRIPLSESLQSNNQLTFVNVDPMTAGPTCRSAERLPVNSGSFCTTASTGPVWTEIYGSSSLPIYGITGRG